MHVVADACGSRSQVDRSEPGSRGQGDTCGSTGQSRGRVGGTPGAPSQVDRSALGSHRQEEHLGLPESGGQVSTEIAWAEGTLAPPRSGLLSIYYCVRYNFNGLVFLRMLSSALVIY